jgi:hypothetical protein
MVSWKLTLFVVLAIQLISSEARLQKANDAQVLKGIKQGKNVILLFGNFSEIFT